MVCFDNIWGPVKLQKYLSIHDNNLVLDLFAWRKSISQETWKTLEWLESHFWWNHSWTQGYILKNLAFWGSVSSDDFFWQVYTNVQNPIWNKRVEYIHKNVRRTKLAQLPDGTSFKGKKITTPFIVLAEMLVITSKALPKESCTIAKLSRQHNIRSKSPKSCIVLSQKALLLFNPQIPAMFIWNGPYMKLILNCWKESGRDWAPGSERLLEVILEMFQTTTPKKPAMVKDAGNLEPREPFKSI